MLELAFRIFLLFLRLGLFVCLVVIPILEIAFRLFYQFFSLVE